MADENHDGTDTFSRMSLYFKASTALNHDKKSLFWGNLSAPPVPPVCSHLIPAVILNLLKHSWLPWR